MELRELFDTQYYHQYDVRAVKKLGLLNTLYLYEYMKNPSNEHICNCLDIDVTKGENIRQALCDIGLLSISDATVFEVGKCEVNYNNLYHIIYGDMDIDAVKSTLKIKCSRKGKDAAIKANLMKSVSVKNEEFRNAFSVWLDSRKGAPLDSTQVKMHVDAINKFANGDLDVALEVLRIGTMSQHGNIEWSISEYKKQHYSKAVSAPNSPQKLVENPKATSYNVNQLGKGF